MTDEIDTFDPGARWEPIPEGQWTEHHATGKPSLSLRVARGTYKHWRLK